MKPRAPLFAFLAVVASCSASGTEPDRIATDSSVGGDSSGDVARPDTESDGGFLTDAPPLDAPPAVTQTIFANTDDELYRMDPTTKAVALIGPFAGLDKSSGVGENMTDVAVNEAGDVWGCSVSSGTNPGHIFAIDVPPDTGEVVASTKATLKSTSRFYALAFAPAGVLGTGETLVGGDSLGDLYLIPTTGTATPQNLGGFGTVAVGDPGAGNTGDKWELSGDIAFFSNAGAPIGLATLRPCTVSGTTHTCDNTNDVLVEIDLVELAKKSSASKLRKRFIGKSGTGYPRLFGIGAWSSSVFAFTRCSGGTPCTKPSQLIEVSLTTGAGTVVKGFTDIDAKGNGWSGAGVSTKAKIDLPK
ncbi:MAG: hypothetical protein ABI175_24690 [Polyangiales bacterium]